MRYRANPIVVEAYRIRQVLGETLILENGDHVVPTKAMKARIEPKVGDFWVIQSDGYVYLNPRDVFERKYTPEPQCRSMTDSRIRCACECHEPAGGGSKA